MKGMYLMFMLLNCARAVAVAGHRHCPCNVFSTLASCKHLSVRWVALFSKQTVKLDWCA